MESRDPAGTGAGADRGPLPVDDLRRLVARWFPGPFGEEEDDADFREAIVEAVQAGRRPYWLGHDLKRQDDIPALKRLQEDLERR